MLKKQQLREKRKRAIRKKLFGTSQRPRLVVSRSNKNISAQIVDDTLGKTLLSASAPALRLEGKKVEIASTLGELVGSKAKGLGIVDIVFDRSGLKYHGRVKAFADGARKAGLNF